MNSTTKLLLKAAQNEGLGSLYERVMLQDLLPSILQKKKIQTIFEYPAHITKGWDNWVLLKKYKVSVFDPKSSLQKNWPFAAKPMFTKNIGGKKKYDLVWNFALFHQQQEIFSDIDALSKRYVLLFTPNVYNWGAPLHWFFHLITMTRCQHPEHGPISLMTKSGLAQFLEGKGYSVVESGYFDLPPWPDFAFSKTQLAQHFPFSLIWGKSADATVLEQFDAATIARTIAQSARWERQGVPEWIQSILAHHQYVLAEKPA